MLKINILFGRFNAHNVKIKLIRNNAETNGICGFRYCSINGKKTSSRIKKINKCRCLLCLCLDNLIGIDNLPHLNFFSNRQFNHKYLFMYLFFILS